MIDFLFNLLSRSEQIFWGYVAFILIMALGTYFTIKNRFFQLREAPVIGRTFLALLRRSPQGVRGVHPLKAFFASVGGMIGIGNIVGIATAVQLGGPGALFWVWVTGICGAMIKYGEIYLGLKYRVENNRGGYDGGPMYFLKAAFRNRWIPGIIALLLCVYGVEIYQFSVITDSISSNWHVNRLAVIITLLGFVLYAGLGGVKRIGQICSWIMPVFMTVYLAMALWVISHEWSALPSIFAEVFSSAFSGHAAVGGFAGASVIMTIHQGIARAAYSADIGIGYDSIIQSESSTAQPENQARLAILGVFTDNFICTLSILLVLVSGVWKAPTGVEGSRLVQTALSLYFPHMSIFMPLFLAICGFTTLIAYFCVGIKSSHYLAPRFGKRIYVVYAALALLFFAFFDQKQALTVMSTAGAMLLIINLLGLFRLRKEILFIRSTSSKKLEGVVSDSAA